MVVAVVSTVAVWRFAPYAPLSEDARATCVEWTHRARQLLRLEAPPQERHVETVAPLPAAPEALKPAPQKPEAQKQDSPKPAERQKPEAQREPEAKKQDSSSAALKAGLRSADSAASKKARYEELTKRLDSLRREILRRNVEQSPEGRKALAAKMAFNKLAAEVEELKKKYGETDSRVMRRRGDLLKLKDDLIRASDQYKKWKESHPDKIVVPEEDPTYRELMAERHFFED